MTNESNDAFERMLTGKLLLVLLLTQLLVGCQRDTVIEREYGARRGKSIGKSVNGTGVLARLFESKGHRVRTTSRLGRVVERSDVVVWFPDRYRPPKSETREYLEEWLEDSPGRTVVFVGRDFDASLEYWNESLKMAPPDEQLETRRRLARRRTDHARERSGYLSREDCGWFRLDRTQATRIAKSLEGTWSQGIDASKAEIVLTSRVCPSDELDGDDVRRGQQAEFHRLLTSDDDVLVAEYTKKHWRGSNVIVVANGSWLLNLPLLNHEHRKLASRLIDECGDGKSRVVFLESGPSGPTLASNEPNRHHGLTAFTVWPVNCILIHLCLLGTILCFCVFPIFGRPREWREDLRSDFGKHIEALGQLMYKTSDREYAKQRREHFLHVVAKESSRREPDATIVVTETDQSGSQPQPATGPVPPETAESDVKPMGSATDSTESNS